MGTSAVAVPVATTAATCEHINRGGKLGKFNPGAMVKEFDEVVFGLYDSGEINPKNDAALFKEKYELGVVHGPIATKFGYHLIKIETRYIAEFDFRHAPSPACSPSLCPLSLCPPLAPPHQRSETFDARCVGRLKEEGVVEL